jgi:quercetin dioxygenase-like cupin family protein
MTVHMMKEPAPSEICGEVFWFKGTLVNIRVSWNEGADMVSVIEHNMPYGLSPPMHIHRDEDEVFHILDGSMRFQIGGKDMIANAGQTVLAPKGVPHSFRVETPGGARCLTITTGGGFERMVREMGEPAVCAEIPPYVEPTPGMIEALTDACMRNGIDIVGEPLS